MKETNPCDEVLNSLSTWLKQQTDWNLSQPGRIRMEGAGGSALAFLVAAHFRDSGRNQLVLARDKESAAYLNNDLETLLSAKSSLFFQNLTEEPTTNPMWTMPTSCFGPKP